MVAVAMWNQYDIERLKKLCAYKKDYCLKGNKFHLTCHATQSHHHQFPWFAQLWTHTPINVSRAFTSTFERSITRRMKENMHIMWYSPNKQETVADSWHRIFHNAWRCIIFWLNDKNFVWCTKLIISNILSKF